MLFREFLISQYRIQFQRSFYWYDAKGQQCIPILSVCLIAKKTRKLFENVYRSCRSKNSSISFNNRFDDEKKESEDVNEDVNDDTNEEDMNDARLLIETARKMHQLMLEQFNTPDRVRNYSALLNEGAGNGKYTCQEKQQFDPVLQLFPCDSEGSENDYESISDDEEYKPNETLPPNLKKSMRQKIEEIESCPHLKQCEINEFPIRPATRMRWNKPRMAVNSLLFFNVKGKPQVTVRLVQILRDRECLSSFFYVLKSPSDVRNHYYQVLCEDDVLGMISNSTASVIRYASKLTSVRVLDSDIFSFSSASHVTGLRYFASTLARNHALDDFLHKTACPKFIAQHRNFMDDLKSEVVSFISAGHDNNNTRRIGWAKWVSAKKHDRWYPWQIATLLLLTNSVKDSLVQEMVQEMFSKFPNPLVICRNPPAFIDFLTSKAKDFTPLQRSFDQSSHGISKSPNYCHQKASYIVAMSKKVVLMWCYKNIAMSSSCLFKSLEEKYCDTRNQESLCACIPIQWLRKCEHSQSSLFPLEYSDSFYSDLPGIGLKMRHLCAEAIYDVVVGPAIDCHCIRFCVEMGTVHGAMNLTQMSECLVSIFRNDQLVDLNEIPASISQILSSPAPSGTFQFTETLHKVSDKHNMSPHMKAFLMHYRRPQ